MSFHYGNIVVIKYNHDRNEMVVNIRSERATTGGLGMSTGLTIGLMLMAGMTLTMTMAV